MVVFVGVVLLLLVGYLRDALIVHFACAPEVLMEVYLVFSVRVDPVFHAVLALEGNRHR